MAATTTVRRGRGKQAALVYDEGAIVRRAAEVIGEPVRRAGAWLGMDEETIRRHLRGHTRPSVEFIVKLCVIGGVSSDWLLFGVGKREAGKRKPPVKRASARSS